MKSAFIVFFRRLRPVTGGVIAPYIPIDRGPNTASSTQRILRTLAALTVQVFRFRPQFGENPVIGLEVVPYVAEFSFPNVAQNHIGPELARVYISQKVHIRHAIPGGTAPMHLQQLTHFIDTPGICRFDMIK